MARKYYTLVSKEKTKNARWAIEFGDYVRSVVVDERDNMKFEDFATDAKTQYKIISTSDQQADIDAAVRALNS